MKKSKLVAILSIAVALLSCTAIVAYAAMSQLSKTYGGKIKITGDANVTVESVKFNTTDLEPDGGGNLNDIPLTLEASGNDFIVSGSVAFKVELKNNGAAAASVTTATFTATGAAWLVLFANNETVITAALTYNGGANNGTIAPGETVIVTFTLTAIDFGVDEVDFEALATGLSYEIAIAVDQVA